MTESRPTPPAERAGLAGALVTALGAGEGMTIAVLLESLDRLGLAVAVKDAASGRHVLGNQRMAALFGLTVQQLIGQTDVELLGAGATAAWRAADQGALATPAGTVADHKLEIAGRSRDFRLVRMPVPPADGSAPRHLCTIWSDQAPVLEAQAQLQQALAQLEQQQVAAETLRREMQDRTLRDGITGLYQPAHFEDQLRREVDLSSREHREFALVSIALDPPGEGVREMGSAAHERILEALGRLLRGNTRAMDASCRIDDRRFGVLLSGVGLATAHARMEGLRRQCATQIVVLDGRNLGFTISMGVASFPHTAQTQDALREAAESALQEALKRGGNHVALASIRFAPA